VREKVIVLDFGGQYNQLIARRVRDLNVYAEIWPYDTPLERILEEKPIGIIFTGGPASVTDPDAPMCDKRLFDADIPILGICYGAQLMSVMLGGSVRRAEHREYGKTDIRYETDCPLFAGLDRNSVCWMSHTYYVDLPPQGFAVSASTDRCPVAAFYDVKRRLYAVQFHPEVVHTRFGNKILENFLYIICEARGGWTMENYIETAVSAIRERVGDGNVLLALSGGVDSSVAAVLLDKAVGSRLTCIFVDHGLLRRGEAQQVVETFSGAYNMKVIAVDAADRFLERLKGVVDPEAKRKIIGEEFIRVFEEEAAKLGDIPFLAQGTIYPDVIESGGKLGATIKSHHNVGGLPEKLAFKEIIEPLSGLFKDEVRVLGRKLGLPASLTERQPFPGPGLAIRVLGEVTKEKLEIVRMADHIMCEEIGKLRRKPEQYFAVYTGAYSVGVKGDDRTYDSVIALRAVHTSDFMTCEYAPLSHKVLSRIASRITREIPSVSRVVYDITSKPPATVEWE